MRDRRLLVGVCWVVAAALALRLGPLYWSPLPFNPDGFSHTSVAETALELGSLPLSEIATDQVGYASLLAVVSALTGDPVLLVGQPASAVVGALTVLFAAVFARRLGLHAGWSHRRARSAALLAAVLLSLEGVYLYRSMPTDEQTAGLLLVPATVLAVNRWLRTGDRRWAAAGVVTFLPLGPLHNLTGLVAAVSVTVLGGVVVVRRLDRATVARAASAFVVCWVYVVGYHATLSQIAGAEVVQVDRLVRVPGLFVAWLLLAVVTAAWFVTTTDRVRRGLVLGVIAILFGLVGINALQTVFPGTAPTRRTLLVGLLPLALPGLLAGLAAHHTGRDLPVGGTVVALVAGPLALVGTGLTARLTFEYLALVYRSHLFVHLPLLALAGVGAVGLTSHRRWFRVGVVVGVVLCAAVSAPIAYGGLETRTYRSLTTEADLTATAYAAGEFGGVATDDHLGRISSYSGGGGSKSAVYSWARGDAPPPDCPTLARASWTTDGVAAHPRPPPVLAADEFRDWQDRNHVVFATDGPDRLTVVVHSGNGSTSNC